MEHQLMKKKTEIVCKEQDIMKDPRQWINGQSPWDRMKIIVDSYNRFEDEKRRGDRDGEND
jgi:hypothetical protein